MQIQPNARVLEGRIRDFVRTHGSVRVAVLIGGLAASLGALLPFAESLGMFGGYNSFSLLHADFYGPILLLLPIALGLFPIIKQPRFKLLAFGMQ